MTTESMRPFGKMYPSIPHLLGSRMSDDDKHVLDGREDLCLTETGTRKVKGQLREYEVIIQEKLDGSCCVVSRWDGRIQARGRAGYFAETSPYPHMKAFADWVQENEKMLDDIIPMGWYLVGEWMEESHGLRYDLPHGPFVALDIMYNLTTRLHVDETKERLRGRLPMPYIISRRPRIPYGVMGDLGMGITNAVCPGRYVYGYHGCLECPEGAVYRAYRNNNLEIIGKYVRKTFEPGKYIIHGKKAGEPAIHNLYMKE